MLTFPSISRRLLHQHGVLFIVLVVMVFFAAPAWAQQGVGTNTAGDYSNFLTTFLSTTAGWADKVRPLAEHTFWALAFIELNVTFWPLALQGATLGEFSWAMVKLILFLGFFYALVLNGGAWMQDIVDSFTQAGATAGGAKSSLNPPNVLFQGLKIGNMLLADASFWHPLNNVGLEISALIIVIVFGIIAAILGLLLLESYITLGAATFFFAFGGCRFTSDYARHAFQASIVIGAKLFLIQLMVATASPLFNSWVDAFHKDNANVLGLIGLSTIYCLACAMIPSIVNRLMGGAGTGGALGTVMGAVGMAAGAASAGVAAANLASAQIASGAAGTGISAAESLQGAGSGIAPDAGRMMGTGGSSGGVGEGGSGDGSLHAGPVSGRSESFVSQGDPGAIKARLDAETAQGDAGGTAANDNAAADTDSAAATANAAKAGTNVGIGSAGEHAARTMANFAGHVIKHVDSSNPFKAAAGEMDSKTSALTGSDGKPDAPASEPPMATAGNSISGGAKLDPEQPLSGDQPNPAAPTASPGAPVPPTTTPPAPSDDGGVA